jgi:hypothetical protein
LGRGQQCGLQRSGHQGFEVAAADVGVGVFGADDFALFGQAYLPAHRARWLGQDGLVAGAAATPHRATPAVEHAQLYGLAGCQVDAVEHVYQRNLGAVKRPVAGENAAVLVAV